MIKIQGKLEGKSSTNLKNAIEELLSNFVDVKGTITLALEDIILEDTHLNKWKKYVAKVNRLKEEPEIGEWTFHNNPDLVKIMEHNKLLKHIIGDWEDNISKGESIDFLQKFEDAIYDYFPRGYKECTVETLLSCFDKGEEVDPGCEYIDSKVVLEVLEVFYTRNPRFKAYW